MAATATFAKFGALGSTAVIGVIDALALAPARAAVERVLNEIDLACSRFRADSELMAVNAAAGAAVRVSPLMLDAVEAALRAAGLTDGDVDPTVGAAVIALGYDRDYDLIAAGDAPVPAPRVRASAVPGWRSVQVNRLAGTVRVARGVKLDLGATAKALAADRAAASAREAVGSGVLVSLGGDIAIAGDAPAGGWRIRVTDDHRSDETAPGQSITLTGGGLATSSTTTRRWQIDGDPAHPTAHHLVDPATGRPADGPWRTVSVTAATCLDANIASTAAIVRGERAAPWLESLGLPSRLVSVDRRVRHLAGWPADGDDLAPLTTTPARIPA
jgi:thiamine biosynthesis lipoprotein